MALPFVNVPLFPDVPDVPGVPPVLRGISSAVQAFSSLAASVDQLAAAFGLSLDWGIYTAFGTPAVTADNVMAVEVDQEYAVSDFPLEQGAFSTYNKVRKPKQYRVVLTRGGSDSDRASFLRAVDAACASMSLFIVSTPEVMYPSVTLERYNYRRESKNGATLLTVEISALEVRLTAVDQFTNTQAPGGASAVNTGAVQTLTATVSQAASITKTVRGLF